MFTLFPPFCPQGGQQAAAPQTLTITNSLLTCTGLPIICAQGAQQAAAPQTLPHTLPFICPPGVQQQAAAPQTLASVLCSNVFCGTITTCIPGAQGAQQAAAPQTLTITNSLLTCTGLPIVCAQGAQQAAAPQTLPHTLPFICPPGVQQQAAAPQTLTITNSLLTCTGLPIVCAQGAQQAAAPQTLPHTLTFFCPPGGQQQAAAPQTATLVACTGIPFICPNGAQAAQPQAAQQAAQPQGLTVFTLCTPVCNTFTPVKC